MLGMYVALSSKHKRLELILGKKQGVMSMNVSDATKKTGMTDWGREEDYDSRRGVKLRRQCKKEVTHRTTTLRWQTERQESHGEKSRSLSSCLRVRTELNCLSREERKTEEKRRERREEREEKRGVRVSDGVKRPEQELSESRETPSDLSSSLRRHQSRKEDEGEEEGKGSHEEDAIQRKKRENQSRRQMTKWRSFSSSLLLSLSLVSLLLLLLRLNRSRDSVSYEWKRPGELSLSRKRKKLKKRGRHTIKDKDSISKERGKEKLRRLRVRHQDEGDKKLKKRKSDNNDREVYSQNHRRGNRESNSHQKCVRDQRSLLWLPTAGLQ